MRALTLKWLRLSLREWAGRLLNLAGVSGFVGDCDYQAGICDASIRVRRHTLFTVVSVNGLDVYFHRLTGEIDGVGFSARSPTLTLINYGQAPSTDFPL